MKENIDQGVKDRLSKSGQSNEVDTLKDIPDNFCLYRVILKLPLFSLDINKQNESGETPLHIAIAKNDVELGKFFIQHEPRTDLVTKKDGYSIINYAKICGNNSILKMINEGYEARKNKNSDEDII